MSSIAATPAVGEAPLWRRLIGFNIVTAIIGAIIGFFIGRLIGGAIHAKSLTYFGTESGENDIQVLFGYLFGTIGFLVGMGFANYPIRRMLGHPPTLAHNEEIEQGTLRYFSLSTDHKVVGMQYLVGIGFFFLIGGLNAMLIRTELLSPSYHVFGANQYLTLVGEHGALMMGMITSGILGPFANYFVPIMIGARRMAFPRIESFTFWLLMCAGVVLVTTVFYGGFQTGWTGYNPLGLQGVAGYDSYIGFFALVGTSMTLLGLNIMATIINMRAPGMTWSRLPIFVWGVFATAFLMMLSAPMLVATLIMAALDRTAQTSFYIAGHGGSNYLYENLFWFFGHPEVYIVAIPGFAIVLEMLPVFARKPLWGYRVAVAGMLGVALLSFFVWQHHLFVSGINADVRPFYMLATELISVPTGFVFLCAMGTIWRGRIRFSVPMWFCIAWVFNFLWGGISGVFLSAVPSDVTTHGSFFSMAHFHYTIMGGLVFTMFAAIYYWVPKMTGLKLNEMLGKIHFWMLFLAFNSTFGPLFAVGLLGQPRRVVTYPAHLQALNVWVSISAYVIGLSMIIFLVNVIWSLLFARIPSEINPWGSKSVEWQLPSPIPLHDFEQMPVFDADPYPYGEPIAVPASVAGEV